MSLLINDTKLLNNFTQTYFFDYEKEEKETEIFLLYFKTKQNLINEQTNFFSLSKNVDRKNTVKLLNKKFLKSYLSDLMLTKKKINSKEFIQHVIHVSILKKNTAIYITDIKGQLKLFCSASSSLKLSGRQKTFQPKVLFALLKYLIIHKAYFLKNKNYHNKKENLPIALHSKHINKSLLKLIIMQLKKKTNIKTICFSNFYPHNGCRNKKIRRLKHKKKNNNKRTKNFFVYSDLNKNLWKPYIKKLNKKTSK